MAKKVCLDAGHYGDYNRSPAVKEYYESHMNWKLQGYLKQELERRGIQVITTRTDPQKDLPLVDRGRMSQGCDLFLSLHSNAAGNGVYENTDYVVAHVQLDGKGDALGLTLARVVAGAMGTKQAPRIAKRQGSSGEYYGVLRGAAQAGTLGIILEHSFHTQTKATRWLLQEENLKTLAREEAEAIAAWLGQKAPLYRVQTGAFTRYENARKQVEALKKSGFDAIIKTETP